MEPDRQQDQESGRGDGDSEQRELDGLTGDGAPHLQDLLHGHRAELVLHVGLDVRRLGRGQRWVAEDVAAAGGLDDGPAGVLRVDGRFDLRQGRVIGEGHRQLGSSGEVDAESESVGHHRDDARDDDDQRQGEEQVAAADDVEPADSWRLYRFWLFLRPFGDPVRDDVRRLLLRLYVRQFGHGPPPADPRAGSGSRSARSRAGCGSPRSPIPG